MGDFVDRGYNSLVRSPPTHPATPSHLHGRAEQRRWVGKVRLVGAACAGGDAELDGWCGPV